MSGAGDANAGKRVGNYEIIKKVGQGGMGAVFAARQVSMDRTVALKVLPPKFAADKGFVQRFMREARSAGQLQHANLIGVYDCGQAGNYYYFSMEFVPGKTLAQLLVSAGPLAEDIGVGYMKKVANALGYAHQKGIVHRDVKPDNIILDAHGEPKLGDLGLAKPMSGDADVTLGGTMLGTPLYIAPEQAKAEQVDGRADIYSLAASFHHLVGGRPLFSAQQPSAIAIKHVTEPPPPIRSVRPDISAGFEAVLLKCLSKDPAKRYSTAAALVTDLEALQAGAAPKASAKPGGRRKGGSGDKNRARRRTGSTPVYRGAAKNGPPIALLAGVGGAVVVGIAVAVLVLSGGSPPPPDDGPPVTRTIPPKTAPKPVAKPQPTGQAAVAATESDAGAAGMLTFAREHLQANPQDFSKARDMMQRAKEAGRDTKVEFEADAAIIELDQAWDAHARDQWQACLPAIDQALAEQQFGKALAAVAAFDPGLADRVAADTRATVQRVQAAGQAAIDGQLVKARTALASKLPDDAMTALDGLADIAYPSGLAGSASAIADLRQQVADLRERLADAANAAWLQAEAELLASLLGDDPAVARKRAQELLKDPANASAADRLQAVVKVVEAIEDRSGFVRGWLQAQLGKPITVATTSGERSGPLVEVDDKWIRVEITTTIGGEEQTFPAPIRWRSIKPAQMATWLAEWQPQDSHGQVALAVLALVASDADTAEAGLTAAGSHPLVVSLQPKIEDTRLGAAEAAARRAWKPLAAEDPASMSEERAHAFLAELKAYQQDHQASEFFTDIEPSAFKNLYELAYAKTASGRLKAGLVAHWDFDQGSDQVAIDLSGHGHDLQMSDKLKRESRVNTLFPPGVSGRGRHGLASCRFLDRAHSGMFAKKPALTVMAWVKLFADTGKVWLVDQMQAPRPFTVAAEVKDGVAVWQLNMDWSNDAFDARAQAHSPLPHDQWHHIACVFDGTAPEPERLKIYIDGKLEGRAATQATTVEVGGMFTLGGTDRWMNGVHDNVRLYLRALPAEDIGAIVALERPRGGAGAAPSADDLIAGRWQNTHGHPIDFSVDGRCLYGRRQPGSWKLHGPVLTLIYANRDQPETFTWQGSHFVAADGQGQVRRRAERRASAGSADLRKELVETTWLLRGHETRFTADGGVTSARNRFQHWKIGQSGNLTLTYIGSKGNPGIHRFKKVDGRWLSVTDVRLTLVPK